MILYTLNMFRLAYSGAAVRVLIVTLLLSGNVTAATSGYVGSTSTGSVTISLKIPATRQVHLAPVKMEPSLQSGSLVDYCFAVTDRSSGPKIRDYHFVVSSIFEYKPESIYRTSSFGQQELTLEERFTVRVKNSQMQVMTEQQVCALSDGNLLHFDNSKSNPSYWLLELVPE